MGRFSGHNDENTGFKGFLKRKTSLPGAVKQVSKRKFRFRGTMTGFLLRKRLKFGNIIQKRHFDFVRMVKCTLFGQIPLEILAIVVYSGLMKTI